MPALSPAWPLVVVKPRANVSTKDAYAAWDNLPQHAPGTATEQWLGGVRRVGNNFQDVVFACVPEVRAAYEALREMTTRDVLLCGSGSAVFCRASSDTDAVRIAENASALQLGSVWVTETTQGGDIE